MTKKTVSALDSLLGEDKLPKAKKTDSAELLDTLLAGRELPTPRKRKLLAEIDALLGQIEAEESDEDEPLVSVTMDLAPCQGLGIMHVGNMYLHGGTYHVTQKVANDLGEISRRGHSHEASITKQETAGRRRRNLDVHTPVAIRNPATGQTTFF